MTLRDYAGVVANRKWLVVAAVLLATFTSVLLSAIQTPIYAAESLVLLEPRGDDALFDDEVRALNKRAIDTEIQVIEGVAVRDRVQQDLGLDSEPPKATASAVGDTDVVQITVRDANPTNAAIYSTAYAEAYIDIRREQAVNELLAASAELQAAIDELQRELDALPDDDPARPALVAQQASFNTTLDQIRVDAALRTGGAVVIKAAEEPTSPVEPTPARSAVLAAMVGLLIGVGAAFIIDYLDDKVRTGEDLQELTHHAVISQVPVDPPPDNRPITISEPGHPAVESYRGLRTNLQFVALDRPLQVLQITSSVPAEGKTTTATNLAVLLAQAGQRVALVDADLRQPRVHEVFGIPQVPGLTELMLGETEAQQAVKHVELSDGNRLSVYASGTIPSNPSEMLSSQRVRSLLSEMGRHYDYVIVDSAPILPVSDSVALAGGADGVIVVVHAGRVTTGSVTDTLQRLDRIGAPIVGLVLNRASTRRRTQYEYGGYGQPDGSSAEPAVTVDA